MEVFLYPILAKVSNIAVITAPAKKKPKNSPNIKQFEDNMGFFYATAWNHVISLVTIIGSELSTNPSKNEKYNLGITKTLLIDADFSEYISTSYPSLDDISILNVKEKVM